MIKMALISFLFMIIYLSGCSGTVNRHSYLSECLTESYLKSHWLPPLEIGTTKRQQLVEKLGEPSGIFENSRIYTYRLIINEWKDGLDDKRYLKYLGKYYSYYSQPNISKKLAMEHFERIDKEGYLLVVTDENLEKYEKEIIASVGEFHLVLVFTSDGVLSRYSIIRIRP